MKNNQQLEITRPDHGYAGMRRREEEEDTLSVSKWQTKNVSAYRQMLGNSPELGPDDRAGSRAFLSGIHRALEHGGWTRGEWRRLHKMKQRWGRRVMGRDARFRVVGTYRGGLTEDQQREVGRLEEQLCLQKKIEGEGKGEKTENGTNTNQSTKSTKQEDAGHAAVGTRPTTNGRYGWGCD